MNRECRLRGVGYTEIQIIREERIQNEAANIVSGLTKSTLFDKLYAEINVVPLKQLRKQHKLAFFKFADGISYNLFDGYSTPKIGYFPVMCGFAVAHCCLGISKPSISLIFISGRGSMSAMNKTGVRLSYCVFEATGSREPMKSCNVSYF